MYVYTHKLHFVSTTKPYRILPASSGAHSELYRCMIRYVVNDCSEGRVCFDGHLDACLCFACFLCRCYLGTYICVFMCMFVCVWK